MDQPKRPAAVPFFSTTSLPVFFLVLGLCLGFASWTFPPLSVSLLGVSALAGWVLLFPALPSRWVTLLICLAALISAAAVTREAVVRQLRVLPQDRDLNKAYQIRARVRYSRPSAYGHVAAVTDVVILSPEQPGFRLKQLLLYLPELETPPRRGDVLTTWVRLKRGAEPQPFRHPMRRLLEQRRPFYYGTVKTLALLDSPEHHQAERPGGLSPGNRELLGVFLRGTPSPIWRARLQPFGLGHLLAISGLHCAFVLVFLRFLLMPLRRPLARALLSCAGLLAFAAWVGWTPSVTRAVLMLCVWQMTPALNRRRSWLGLWTFLALLLAFSDPSVLLNRGYWYSFAASLGLILGARHVKRGPLDHPWLSRLRYVLPILAAQLFVIPIHLVYGPNIRLSDFLWNLVGPAFLLLIGMLLLTVCLALLIPPLLALANACEALLGDLIQTVIQMEPWWGLSRLPQEPLVALAFLTLLALSLGSGLREWRWYGALAVMAVFLCLGRPPGGERLVMLDVGQGLSLLHVDERGNGVVFDAGGATPVGVSFDDVLKLHGVRRLKSVYVSHLDSDHYDLLDQVRQRDGPLYLPPETHQRAGELAELEGFSLKTAKAGDRFRLGALDVTVLWPEAGVDAPNDNEGSLVLRFKGKDFSLLFMGDTGLWVEQQLATPSMPGTRVLVVGHHGSKTATGDPFLEAVRPHVALISRGRNNAFGHPHPSVTERLSRRGVVIIDTGEVGSSVIALDGWLQLKSTENKSASAPSP